MEGQNPSRMSTNNFSRRNRLNLLTVICITTESTMDMAVRRVRGRFITERLSVQAARSDKPAIAVVDSGSLYDSFALALEEGGLPVFRSGDQAMRTLGKYIQGRLHAREIVLELPNS